MFCEKCGTELNEGAAFCHNCGAPAHVEKEKPDYNQKQSMASPIDSQPKNNPQAAPQQPASNPQAAPQQPVQQNSVTSYQQTNYQQPSQFGNLGSTISTARTLGILSIVGAFTITIGGLVCGIIGLLKVKDLKVPSQLVAQRDSAKKLNIIGLALSAGLMVLAFILLASVGCSDSYYY